MTTSRRAYGDYGEELVVKWYLANGYEIVARNWRSGRNGELDIVARKPGVIVFCEVKTRRNDAFGSPVESITWAKQRRIRQLATLFLSSHSLRTGQIRFDVGSVAGTTVEVFEDLF